MAVILAKAGINNQHEYWIPASAGMINITVLTIIPQP
jgi:hypothetical protein